MRRRALARAASKAIAEVEYEETRRALAAILETVEGFSIALDLARADLARMSSFVAKLRAEVIPSELPVLVQLTELGVQVREDDPR